MKDDDNGNDGKTKLTLVGDVRPTKKIRGKVGGDRLAVIAKLDTAKRSVAKLSRLNDPAPELPADQKPKRSTKPRRVGTTPKGNKIARNKSILLKCLAASLGVVTDACEMAGVSRSTFYDYCNSDPEFAAAAADTEELAIDFAESQLKKKIALGDTTAMIFFLKTKGKDRGYIERQERTGANGAPLPAAGSTTNVVVFLPDNGRGDGPKPVEAADIVVQALKSA